jgi:hypothetical protein
MVAKPFERLDAVIANVLTAAPRVLVQAAH